MDRKKPYGPMQVSRVELNHQQAVLSVCSLMTASVLSGSAAGNCRGGMFAACKGSSWMAGGDMSARPS